MMRRTKIVATLGPASNTAEIISDLIDCGVNIFRLNFSHGSHQSHTENTKLIRKLALEKQSYVGILGDLQGPKIRIGDLQQEEKLLELDQKISLVTDEKQADSLNDKIHIAYSALPEQVVSGDTLLLDDGLIRLEVTGTAPGIVHCEVSQAGTLKSRKGINRLGGGLSADVVTEKDLDDLKLAISLEFDFVAVSFPSCAADLNPVREALKAASSEAKIIAKIERAEAVASDATLQGIIDASDGVMVARGDLGVEVGDAQLIGIQKHIIARARRSNKPVITATQMMESMISQPVPTRAEVFDVANAVLDGTDAVMLSAETASGEFPAKVVVAMSETALGAEAHPLMSQSSYRVERVFETVEESIAMAVMYAANHLKDIKAIVCLTESGTTPLLASRLSSTLPIYGISRNQTSCRRMSLYRGVSPIFFDVTQVAGDAWSAALELVAIHGELAKGDRIAVTCGDLEGEGGSTNTVKILEL